MQLFKFTSISAVICVLISLITFVASDDKVQAANQPIPLEKIMLKDSIQLGMSLDNVFKILKKQSDLSSIKRHQAQEVPHYYKQVLIVTFKKDQIWDRNDMELSFTPSGFNEAPNQLYKIVWSRSGQVDIDFDTIKQFIAKNGLHKPSCNNPFDTGSPGYVTTDWHAVWIQPYASYEPSYGACGPSNNRQENINAYLTIHVFRHGTINIYLHKPQLGKKFSEVMQSRKKMERREKGKNVKF